MAQILIAEWRITVAYTVSSLQHKARMYVSSTGATSGGVVQVIYRDLSLKLWNLAAQGAVVALARIGGTGTTFDTALLEQLVGSIWIVKDVLTPSAPSLSGGSIVPGMQNTIVMRDINFNKTKVEMMEGALATFVHYNSQPAPGAAANFWMEFAGGSGVTTHSPYNWQVSRSALYTLGGVGMTVAGNRKLRRRRGLT